MAASQPSPGPSYIYKILDPAALGDPETSLVAAGAQLPVTPLDEQDGFIHLSRRPQVSFVLERFFKDVREVALVRVAYGRLCEYAERQRASGHAEAAVKWDRAGESVFPHYYGGKFGVEVCEGHRLLKNEGQGWPAELHRIEAEGWFVD